MRDLLILDNKEIADMMAGITKLPINQGGCQIGAILTNNARHLHIGAGRKKDKVLIWNQR
jgi:hypothetical protein